MPDSLRELCRVGNRSCTGMCGTPFTGIRFVDEHSTVSAEFRAGEGLGVRRLDLASVAGGTRRCDRGADALEDENRTALRGVPLRSVVKLSPTSI